jgi:hypothetical protein
MFVTESKMAEVTGTDTIPVGYKSLMTEKKIK